MAIDEVKFKELRKKAEGARQTRDKAAGQLEAAMQRLKDDFDCDTIEAAERKVVKLERAATKAEGEFDKAVTVFEGEWDEQSDED